MKQKHSNSNPISLNASIQSSQNKQNLPHNIMNILQFYQSSKISQKSPSLATSNDQQMLALFNHLKQRTIQSKQVTDRQSIQNKQVTGRHYEPQLIFHTKKFKLIDSCQRFLKLLSQVFSQQSLSLQQGIQICQRNQIINEKDLTDIQENRQAVYQWPPTVRQLLNSNLGQLRIELIKKKIYQGLVDFNQSEFQLIRFLIPKKDKVQELNVKLIAEKYQQFIETNRQMVADVDQYKSIFFNQFLRKIISKCQYDKNYSVLLQKNAKKYSRKGFVSYQILKSLFQQIKFDQRQITSVFKYLFYKQTGHLMSVTDKTKQINVNTIFTQLFKHKFHQLNADNMETSTNYTSRLRQEQVIKQGNFIVQSLLREKQNFLEILRKKDKQIEFLTKKNRIYQLDVQSTKRQCQQRVKLQKEVCNRKYERKIKKLQQDSKNSQRLAQWYRHQLECVYQQLNTQGVLHRKTQEF